MVARAPALLTDWQQIQRFSPFLQIQCFYRLIHRAQETADLWLWSYYKGYTWGEVWEGVQNFHAFFLWSQISPSENISVLTNQDIPLFFDVQSFYGVWLHRHDFIYWFKWLSFIFICSRVPWSQVAKNPRSLVMCLYLWCQAPVLSWSYLGANHTPSVA